MISKKIFIYVFLSFLVITGCTNAKKVARPVILLEKEHLKAHQTILDTTISKEEKFYKNLTNVLLDSNSRGLFLNNEVLKYELLDEYTDSVFEEGKSVTKRSLTKLLINIDDEFHRSFHGKIISDREVKTILKTSSDKIKYNSNRFSKTNESLDGILREVPLKDRLKEYIEYGKDVKKELDDLEN